MTTEILSRPSIQVAGFAILWGLRRRDLVACSAADQATCTSLRQELQSASNSTWTATSTIPPACPALQGRTFDAHGHEFPSVRLPPPDGHEGSQPP